MNTAKTVKIVINACYGGFGLSDIAKQMLAQRKGEEGVEWFIPRHDPDLIAVVEELGVADASGKHAQLEIVEIVGNKYIIEEYDGSEFVVVPESINWVTVEI